MTAPTGDPKDSVAKTSAVSRSEACKQKQPNVSTGDLREAAQKLVDKLYAMKPHFSAIGAVMHVHGGYDGPNFANELEALKLSLAAPPPEPIEGPWKAKGDGEGWWVENKDDGNTVSRRGWGNHSFTESQARRVERALNEDEAEAKT